VEHTLQDLHEDVEVQIEREIKEVESDIEENLRELHEKFEREAEAQRLFLEASLLDLTEKFDEALDKYDDVLDMKPDHHLAIQRKARVLNRKGQSEMALKELQESLDHSPESPSLLYDIARTYALMSRKDRMLEFLEKSISIDDEYKDEALNDEAFKEFWDDRDFKDLAEA
jgi:tetratricopeptide (TPR) repeat protein